MEFCAGEHTLVGDGSGSFHVEFSDRFSGVIRYGVLPGVL